MRAADAGFQAFCLDLGRQVRELRRGLGLTQEDMMGCGFSLRHFQRIEAGRSVTLRTIWKLSTVLQVSPRELLPARSPGNPPKDKEAAARGARSAVSSRRSKRSSLRSG